MKRLLTTALMSLALAACVTLMPTAGAAQAGFDEDTRYKAKLGACLDDKDYPCAIDVLINHGRNSGNPGVVVNLQQGPTLLGAQLFAVLDLAQGNVPPQTFYDMSQAALNYALDAQPESSIAAGPFILQAAEGCLGVKDKDCLRAAVQPLQLLMSLNQFYIKGATADAEKPDVNTRVINLIKAYNELNR